MVKRTVYIQQAQQICPNEPHVLHELGVLHYLNGAYDEAVASFLQVSVTAEPVIETAEEGFSFHFSAQSSVVWRVVGG